MSRKKQGPRNKGKNAWGKYKSPLEVDVSRAINRLKKKVKVSYESQALPYVLTKTYYPDFVCIRPDGTVFYIEAKGYFRPSDRTKLRAVAEARPRPDVRLLFQADNKISSKSSMRYSDWCVRYGFPYAVKEVPEEWFK